jgi:tetratricopeptide (TPR) repeat protein
MVAVMRIWLATMLLVLASATARASDPIVERAHVHTQAGIDFYDEASYEAAAHEFEEAYRLKPLPELQYNLAECYERLNRPEDAAQSYQKYLDGKTNAPDRELVETRIRNLRARKVEPPREKTVLKTIVVYRDLPPPPGRATRWAAYGVGVLALGALASGIATSVLATQAANDVEKLANPSAPGTFDGKARDAQNRGQTEQIVAGVSFGVAAIGAAGAIGLWFLGRKIDREARYSLSPGAGPGSASISASVRF